MFCTLCKMLETSHVTLRLHVPSHSVLICLCSFKSLVVFVSFFLNHFLSPRHSVHAFSLCCCCYMPYDNVCHLIMTVQLFCWYFQLFLLAVDFFFIFRFFYLIFLCSSPDCMLVSQATFQSKHYSFFCSSNISVPTLPLPHLLSCELLCGNVRKPPFAMLHPEPSLFLCTLQPLQAPSAPTIMADGHF